VAAETTIDHLCWSARVGDRAPPGPMAACKTPRPPADLGSRSVLKVLKFGGAGEPRSCPRAHKRTFGLGVWVARRGGGGACHASLGKQTLCQLSYSRSGEPHSSPPWPGGPPPGRQEPGGRRSPPTSVSSSRGRRPRPNSGPVCCRWGPAPPAIVHEPTQSSLHAVSTGSGSPRKACACAGLQGSRERAGDSPGGSDGVQLL